MNSLLDPHCISVYVVRQTTEGPRYLLIRRCSSYLPGTWQMVTGKIETGETAPEAAVREIQEETGLTPHLLYSADAVETFYMKDRDKVTFVPVFIAFVEETKVTLSPTEHDAYEWLPMEEAKKRLTWTEQKRIIGEMHEQFFVEKPNEWLLIQRAGVYGLAIQNGKWLLVKQKKGPHRGKYDLPGGRLEIHETITEALKRELREEVAMQFKTMEPLQHLTATTSGIDEKGNSYRYHQIGLTYRIRELTPSQDTPELEHAWLDPTILSPDITSPFVQLLKEKFHG